MAIFKGFIGQAYAMDSYAISTQRSVNWYPEVQGDDNAAPGALRPTPGYKLLFTIVDDTLPAGSFNRGMYRTSKGIGLTPEDGGSVIAVVGPNVYWIKQDNSYEKLGTMSNLMTKISMVDDGFGLVIADGTNLHRLDIATKVFSTLPFTNDMRQPTQVEYFNSYTMVIGKAKNLPQNSFWWSRNFDNQNWDALDNTQAEQSQDPVTAMTSNGGFLYMLGPDSYELWSTTGDSKFPFARSYASSGSVGIHAPLSLCKIGNGVFMLGQSNQGSVGAFKSNGTEFQRISTLALDQEWSNYVTTDCTAWTYSERGHDFVLFNFDAANKTWCYCVDQNTWHERASRNEATDTLNRWEPNYCIQRVTGQRTQMLVGDRTSTNIYEMRTGFGTENGRHIRRIRSTSHINDQQNMVMVNAVRFDMDTGVGISDEDPANYTKAPTVMLKYSQNRGKT